MKKSIIWLLTIIMACALLGLILVQIMYIENMVRMRNEQFSEVVMRSLYRVSEKLQQDETKYFLNKDIEDVEQSFYSLDTSGATQGFSTMKTAEASKNVYFEGKIRNLDVKGNSKLPDIASAYESRQEIIKKQYLYQKDMLNEVILNILSQSSNRPLEERADSAVVKSYLKSELENNGLNMPFEFALVGRNNNVVYQSDEFDGRDERNTYSLMLFPNDPVNKLNSLKVTFPTKGKYIFSSIKFMFPSFVFTIILLMVFVYTIIVAFRQKKLTEMKNDFINNMTHEFKTPISTISLAAQMLNDDSVRKSPNMLQHISTVINDETKRLRFQVEKVLQMSMFDRQKATLKLQEVDANALIDNVMNTYKIKVERYGGAITAALDAEDSIISVDEMHFTNVIFNLLDNALKYRREEVPLKLKLETRNIGEESLEIKICDNGIGIKKEDLKKIFEKFYRVSTGNRHDVKGFGLGLAYVHKMITEFKGEIRVESEISVGSKFIITLPLIK